MKLIGGNMHASQISFYCDAALELGKSKGMVVKRDSNGELTREVKKKLADFLLNTDTPRSKFELSLLITQVCHMTHEFKNKDLTNLLEKIEED